MGITITTMLAEIIVKDERKKKKKKQHQIIKYKSFILKLENFKS